MYLTELLEGSSWFMRALVLFALAMVLAPLEGCTKPPKPPCPVVSIYPVQDRTGAWYFILDEKGMEALRLRLVGLRDRTCEPTEIWATGAHVQ